MTNDVVLKNSHLYVNDGIYKLENNARKVKNKLNSLGNVAIFTAGSGEKII